MSKKDSPLSVVFDENAFKTRAPEAEKRAMQEIAADPTKAAEFMAEGRAFEILQKFMGYTDEDRYEIVVDIMAAPGALEAAGLSRLYFNVEDGVYDSVFKGLSDVVCDLPKEAKIALLSSDCFMERVTKIQGAFGALFGALYEFVLYNDERAAVLASDNIAFLLLSAYRTQPTELNIRIRELAELTPEQLADVARAEGVDQEIRVQSHESEQHWTRVDQKLVAENTLSVRAILANIELGNYSALSMSSRPDGLKPSVA